MDLEHGRWLTIYDWHARTFTIVRTDAPWLYTMLELDRSVSDPKGDFAVYRSSDALGEQRDERPFVALVRIALNAGGSPKNVHRDFNTGLLGTPTLWPAKQHHSATSYLYNMENELLPLWREVTPSEWIAKGQDWY